MSRFSITSTRNLGRRLRTARHRMVACGFGGILVLAAATASAVTYNWDPSISGGTSLGGNGTWDANVTANWWDSTSNVVWPIAGTDNDADFGGTGGTVTVAGGVTVNDITFSTTGYTVGGSTITFNGTTPVITTPGAGNSATINSAITNPVGLTLNGAGTLNLGGVAAMTNADLRIGTTTSGNTFNVANGGKVQFTTNHNTRVGDALAASNNNVLHVSTPGSSTTSADWSLRVGSVWIGEGSSGNELRVSNGAYMRRETSSSAQATWNLGMNTGADNNRLVVTGAGSVATMVGSQALRQFLNVGKAGNNNYMRVENGGVASVYRLNIAGDTYVGGGDDNYIVAAGVGSTFNMIDSQAIFTVGASPGATGNSFRVESGATATLTNNGQNTRAFQVGGGSSTVTSNGSDNNYILVSGASSTLNVNHLQPLSLGGSVISNAVTDSNTSGNTSSGNEVRVYNGGTLNMSTTSLYVMGVNSSVRLGDGNAVAAATVGTTAAMSGGVFLKNSDGRLYFNNGRLSRTTTGDLVTGSGQVVLNGPGYFSMPSTTTGTVSSVISGSGNLVKEGQGILVLSASNSYSGNTSVLDGELQLNNAFLSDTADVLLSGNGFLRLSFSGTDTINSLFLDGVQQAPGVYSVSNLADWIDGTGSLTVITGVPEPASIVLTAAGGLAIAALVRRRKVRLVAEVHSQLET